MDAGFLLTLLVLSVLYGVLATLYGYHHGKHVERMATLKRSREAFDLFFGRPTVSMIANWRTSADLLSYVAGTRGLPDKVTYDYLSYNPKRVTFERVDKPEET